MAREFKPLRFFVMMGAAAFVVCAATAFYTHRANYGKTAPERAAYAIGEKAGEEAPADAKLADRRRPEHGGARVFQAAGVGRTAELGSGLRERIHGGIQKDASPE
jgi:hypothetical protein